MMMLAMPRRLQPGCVVFALVLFLLPANVDADAARCQRATTMIVVRHADRQGTDDALTAAGVQRAHDLARALAKSQVGAVYHSDTERTRLTAQPLAAQLGVEPVVLPARDVEGLVAHVLRNHCGETVLVVGHSNTVPLIIAAAGGAEIADLADNEFDDLFVLSIGSDATTVTRMEYGAPSP
jgi:broad specificity phosphatase PhoE